LGRKGLGGEGVFNHDGKPRRPQRTTGVAMKEVNVSRESGASLQKITTLKNLLEKRGSTQIGEGQSPHTIEEDVQKVCAFP